VIEQLVLRLSERRLVGQLEEVADDLRGRLRAAVAAEDFELAAALRDRLRTLEGVE